MRRHLLPALALAMLFVGTAALPAQAKDRGSNDDRRISVSGGVVVAAGETVDGPVVSLDGPATIDGDVTGNVFVGTGRLRVRGHVEHDVLVVDGDAVITGRVDGDVVTVTGRVTVADGGHVSGDVISRRAPVIAAGTVRGDVKRLDAGNLFRGFLIVVLIFLWISVTLSTAILGLVFLLVFARAADATAVASRRVGASFGWGALVGIAGPLLAVGMLFTVVGIPLGLGTLSLFGVLAPLGYVASSLALGRTMVKSATTGGRIGAFFAGFGILRAAALLPGIGFLVGFVACIFGLGALTIAAWRAGHGPAPVVDDRAGPEAPADDAAAASGPPPGVLPPAPA